MTTYWRTQFNISMRYYPYLPEWYQRKMKLIKTTTSSISEEVNLVWYYLGG